MTEHPTSTESIAAIDALVALLATLDDVPVEATEVLAELVAVERLGRLVDARRARLAGQVAHLSRPELGDEGLARVENFPTAAKLVAAITGVPVREARARIELGRRLRGVALLGDVVGPEPFPEVSAALSAGELGVDAAAAITRELDDLRTRGIDPVQLAAAETTLVGLGCQTVGGYCFTADEVARAAVRLRETLDPDGLEPRAERMQELRGMTITRCRDGMLRGRFALTPEQGGIWLTASQAMNSPRVAPRFTPTDVRPDVGTDTDTNSAASTGADTGLPATGTGADTGLSDRASAGLSSSHPHSDPAIPAHSATDSSSGALPSSADGLDYALRDTRTTSQKLVDTITDLISRAAALPDMPRLNGAAPTINVHLSLTDLSTQRGAAWIDGIDDPIPVSTVEQLLCHADIIPTVLATNGRILHHGKTRRLFTPAQNRALATRDGGCIWPGCDRPPSWTETHHVQPWQADTHLPGATDTDNGVLLCHFHHSHLHRSAWKLTMIHGAPHIIPPRWIDTTQTPRPCTQRRTTTAPPGLNKNAPTEYRPNTQPAYAPNTPHSHAVKTSAAPP